MTSATIRPTGSPYQSDGYVRSSNATYSTALTGGTLANVNTDVNRIDVGQQLDGATYRVFQGQLRFDLSGIPSGAVVSSPLIEITKWFGLSTGTLYAYLYDAGSTVDTADYVDATTIAGSLTLLATANLASASGTFQMTSEAALATAIEANIGGNIGILLTTSQVLAASTPTGDQRFVMRPGEYATEAQRPALILDYSTDIEIDVPSGALTIAGQTPAPLLDRVTAVPAGALTIAGQAPSVAVDAVIAIPAAALVIAGQAPAVLLELVVSVPAGAMTVAGQVPGVAIDRITAVPVAALTIAGQAPSVLRDRAISIPAGALVAQGRVPALSVGKVLSIPAASLVLAGLDLRRAGAQWNAAPASSGVWTDATAADGTWTPAPLAN